MKKLLVMALVATGVAGFTIGCAGKDTALEDTQKVKLKIASVETVDTYTAKTRPTSAQSMALQKVPYSEDDIANATPEEALKMARENRSRRLANQKAQAAIAFEAYARAQEHYEGVKMKLEGTVFGKQVILAVDKFAAAAGKHFDSDRIEFLLPMNYEVGQNNQHFMEMNSADTLYFINLIFDNPRIESGRVVMAGQEIKKTRITIAVTYQVQAPNGRMETSDNVKKEKVLKTTGAVQHSGAVEGAIIDAMEEALDEVAKRINNHFVTKMTIKATPSEVKKDDDDD